MDYMTYEFSYGNVQLSVRADLQTDGSIKLVVTADQGSVDLKALYFSDGDSHADFGGFSKQDASLNMNGEGSLYDGQHVAWDDAIKLGNGEVTTTGDADTFIAAGTNDSTYTMTLTGMTLDDLKFMGIRGQGGTADGIKAVAMGTLNHDVPPVDDHFPVGLGLHASFVYDGVAGSFDPSAPGNHYGYYVIDVVGLPNNVPNSLNSFDLDTANPLFNNVSELNVVRQWLEIAGGDPVLGGISNLKGVIIQGSDFTSHFYDLTSSNASDDNSISPAFNAFAPDFAVDSTRVYLQAPPPPVSDHFPTLGSGISDIALLYTGPGGVLFSANAINPDTGRLSDSDQNLNSNPYATPNPIGADGQYIVKVDAFTPGTQDLDLKFQAISDWMMAHDGGLSALTAANPGTPLSIAGVFIHSNSDPFGVYNYYDVISNNQPDATPPVVAMQLIADSTALAYQASSIYSGIIDTSHHLADMGIV